jgi:AcrR family transcriptional regulator
VIIQRSATKPRALRRKRLKVRRGRPPLRDARQRILVVAAALFEEKEFHRVSTEEVALCAGIGKGTVYRHFPSKEVLYVAASIYGLSRLRNALMRDLKAARSGRAAIEVILRQLLAYFWYKQDFFFLLQNFHGLTPAYRRRYESERLKLSLLIRRALADGVKGSAFRRGLDVQLAAEALLGMVRAVSRVRAYSATLADASNGVVTLFFNGCLCRRRLPLADNDASAV